MKKNLLIKFAVYYLALIIMIWSVIIMPFDSSSWDKGIVIIPLIGGIIMLGLFFLALKLSNSTSAISITLIIILPFLMGRIQAHYLNIDPLKGNLIGIIFCLANMAAIYFLLIAAKNNFWSSQNSLL